MSDNEEKKLRVPYALACYGNEEIAAVNEVLNSHVTSNGKYTKNFEERVASLFGKKYGVMVNSGSSANLLALEVLNLPKGSEVVTPILTFSTTISPLIQKGLVPSFIDVEIESYQADLGQLKDAVNKKTKCLMIPHLIGNVADLQVIRKIADDNHLRFIEDSCDTLGAKFDGKPTGAYSDISTSSFYGSHIITAGGGGGIICINDSEWHKRCRILSAWGRSSAANESEDIEVRFKAEASGIQYDSKFIFDEVGYNFLPLEISAAFGFEQLNKLESFTQLRGRNFSELIRFFSEYREFFILPKQLEKCETNWLAFPLTIKPDAPFSRIDLVKFLEKNNIQTRLILTGNLLRQPGFKNISHNSFKKEFPNADYVMKNSFLIGCHQGLSNKHIAHMENTFTSFLNKF